jgi:hypothetical protein
MVVRPVRKSTRELLDSCRLSFLISLSAQRYSSILRETHPQLPEVASYAVIRESYLSEQ